MRIEELVGQRIRARREDLELTQDQVGQQLAESLGRAWSRQAVSAAEKGDRSFTAAELVAIAATLKLSIGALLIPPAGVTEVELPSGAVLSRGDLIAAVLPMGSERMYSEVQAVAVRLAQTVDLIQRSVSVAATDVELINDGLLITRQFDELRPRLARLSAEETLAAPEDPDAS